MDNKPTLAEYIARQAGVPGASCPNLPNTYIGMRYVPEFADPVEWDATMQTEYEYLKIVTWQGNSYTSRTWVPKNIPITNTDYWILTGNYNAQVEAYRKEVQEFDGRITAVEQCCNTFKSQITVDDETVSISNPKSINITDNGNMVAGGNELIRTPGSLQYVDYQFMGQNNTVGGCAGLFQHSDDTSCSFLAFAKTRGETPYINTKLAKDDDIGEIRYIGSNNDTYLPGGYITAAVDRTLIDGMTMCPNRFVFGPSDGYNAAVVASMRPEGVSTTKLYTGCDRRIGGGDLEPAPDGVYGIMSDYDVSLKQRAIFNINCYYSGSAHSYVYREDGPACCIQSTPYAALMLKYAPTGKAGESFSNFNNAIVIYPDGAIEILGIPDKSDSETASAIGVTPSGKLVKMP